MPVDTTSAPLPAARALREPVPSSTRHSSALGLESRGAVPLRVAVVKWDRFSGEAIAGVVGGAFPSAVVAIFSGAAMALESFRRQPVDVGIFGLTLPDMDGLDLLALVACEGLARRRLVMTWRTDERTQHELKKADVHAVVETISEGPDRLIRALRQAVAGGPAAPAKREPRAPALETKQEPLVRILSDRELQVLAVLADGSDDATAAEALCLAAATVHTHRQRIMRKLGVQTRTALVRESLRRGVIRFTEHGVLRPGLESALAARRGEDRAANGSH